MSYDLCFPPVELTTERCCDLLKEATVVCQVVCGRHQFLLRKAQPFPPGCSRSDLRTKEATPANLVSDLRSKNLRGKIKIKLEIVWLRYIGPAVPELLQNLLFKFHAHEGLTMSAATPGQ
jgi:hypothetical protein